MERFEKIFDKYTEAVKHTDLGISLYRAGLYEEAEREFRDAIKINPNLSETHYNLGLFFEHLNRYEEAAEEYREAVRISPDYFEAHYKLGVLFFLLDRYKESEKEYKEVIRIDPNLPAAHYSLGVLLEHHLERYDEAKKEILAAKALYQNQGDFNGVTFCDIILERFSDKKM